MKSKMSIFILIIIIVLLFAIFLLAFINRESEVIMQIIIKVLFIAIITAFVLIVLEIDSPIQSDSKTVEVLILRNKEEVNVKDFSEKLLMVGSSHQKGYGLLHNITIFNTKNEEVVIDSDTISLDLLEMAFWTWLSKKYHIHWYVNTESFEGISGSGISINEAEDAEKNPTELGKDELQEYLKDNMYTINPGTFWGISLPSGSSVNVIKRNKNNRVFQIKNKYIDFKISIYRVGSTGLLYTSLGENIRKTLLSPDEWYVDNFKVSFESNYKKIYRGSLQTKKQKKWVNEIMEDFYNDFDWLLLKSDLEKSYN